MSAVHVEPTPVTQPADPDKLNAFLGRMVGDLAPLRPAHWCCSATVWACTAPCARATR
jgi:hypothetical protein